MVNFFLSNFDILNTNINFTRSSFPIINAFHFQESESFISYNQTKLLSNFRMYFLRMCNGCPLGDKVRGFRIQFHFLLFYITIRHLSITFFTYLEPPSPYHQKGKKETPIIKSTLAVSSYNIFIISL